MQHDSLPQREAKKCRSLTDAQEGFVIFFFFGVVLDMGLGLPWPLTLECGYQSGWHAAVFQPLNASIGARTGQRQPPLPRTALPRRLPSRPAQRPGRSVQALKSIRVSPWVKACKPTMRNIASFRASRSCPVLKDRRPPKQGSCLEVCTLQQWCWVHDEVGLWRRAFQLRWRSPHREGTAPTGWD